MVPRLRKDLVATAADDQGVACVEVVDPTSGTSFRFYDFEYALAQQLTGQPLAQVMEWAQATYGIELGTDVLDQFVEKLTGLGFLEGSTSGAQPAILAPFSPSSGSQPFGELPTTVAVDGISTLDPIDRALSALGAGELQRDGGSAVQPVTGSASSVGARILTPAPVGAAAPQRLLSADAKEYRLKDVASGLWERPAGLAVGSVKEPSTLLPQLQVLADPLPPVTGAPPPASPPSAAPVPSPSPSPSLAFPMASDMPKPVAAPAGLSIPVRWPPPDLSARGAPSPFPPPRAPARAELAAAREREAVPTETDTPLASIAHAIAESFASAPAGALDAGTGSGPRSGPSQAGEASSPGPIPLAGSPAGSAARSGPHPAARAGASSWAANLADEVQEPSEERPQDPSEDPSEDASEDRPPLPLVHAVGSRGAGGRKAAGLGDMAGSPSQLADAEERDRRQPPPPELVVMPPMAEPLPRSAPPRRRGFALPLVLVLLAAAAGAAYWFLRPQPSQEAPAPAVSSAEAAPQVHVVSPQPTTFYRWFESAGVLTPGQDQTLSFRAAGKVQEALPPGTTFAAGEAIGRLRGVAERELAVNRLRSRIAYYEQLRDSNKSEEAQALARQAEMKLVARRQELAAAQAAVAEWEIRPRVPGTIAELFVAPGALVKPGIPIFRVRSTGPRAIFPLSAEDAAKARALKFCRVETVPGTGGGSAAGGSGAAAPPEGGARPIDCAISAVAGGAAAGGSPPDGKVAVDLIGAGGVAPGTQFRLASARYDGVFPLPRAGLVRDGGVDHVWIVSGGGKFAERRTVEVVDTVDDLALIAHGIAVGDAVVVDPPATLKGGAEINVVR